MNFSAPHQRLYPLRHHADRIADHHRDTLHRVFGLAPGPSPDPLVASTAVLATGRARRRAPLLVIADDVPWIDRAGAAVLGFAARRISDDPKGRQHDQAPWPTMHVLPEPFSPLGEGRRQSRAWYGGQSLYGRPNRQPFGMVLSSLRAFSVDGSPEAAAVVRSQQA